MQQAKQLAEDLLQSISSLGFDRHKLIIQVMYSLKLYIKFPCYSP